MSTPSDHSPVAKNSHRSAVILTILILAGLVVGAVFGELLFRRFQGWAGLAGLLEVLDFVGSTLFMGLLKMVLIPLVVSSVIMGVASIGDPSKLGFIGITTLVYYTFTMVMAVLLGLALVTAIRPGEGIDQAFRDSQVEQFQQSEPSAKERVQGASGTGLWGAFRNIVSQMVPSNPLGSAAEGQMLPVISFSLLLGVALTVVGPAGRPVLAFFDSLLAAIMRLVEWILWLAPIGVFALMTVTVAKIGLGALGGPLFYYAATVLVGLSIHGLIVLPLVLLVFGRCNPFTFLHAMRGAIMTALATDSSSATLPVTIECAEQFGGCSRRASRFVLPLGATVNMDGTALYEAVAVVFMFQCYGIPLGPVELAIIVVTATLAAIGAAGIPSAGLVTMVIVVEAVNSSLGGEKALPLEAIGIVLGIDRLLDMWRTVVNVWGDAVGAKIITRIAPDDPREGEAVAE